MYGWEINGVLELSYDKSGILESRSLIFDFSHFHFIEYLWFNGADALVSKLIVYMDCEMADCAPYPLLSF